MSLTRRSCSKWLKSRKRKFISEKDKKSKQFKLKEMPNRIEDLSPIPHSPHKKKTKGLVARYISPNNINKI